jgi:hypothetical protein
LLLEPCRRAVTYSNADVDNIEFVNHQLHPIELEST